MPAASAAPAPQGSAPVDVIPPAEYPALWKRILAHFMSIHRIDIYTCFSKSTLVYAGGARAVIAAPQAFIVQACNTEAFQKITADAFRQITGKELIPHTVLKGSAEEAEARAEAASPAASSAAPSSSAPVPAPAQAVSAQAAPAPDADGYIPVAKDQIAPEDLRDPLLAAALKIAPDCDIYEKKS